MLFKKSCANKFKFLIGILIILLIIDGWLHKGMVRVMLPKSFSYIAGSYQKPIKNNILINKETQWKKAVNTIDKLNNQPLNASGIEIDMYFDTLSNSFSCHHEVSDSIITKFDDLLKIYAERGMTASIWIDFKNLSIQNMQSSLTVLLALRNKYRLQNKILVESTHAELLNSFADSGFFTSYYAPYFNPYLLSKDSLKVIANQIKNNLKNSKIQALSGYYFQYPFLHTCYPNYPILVWAGNDKFSLINHLFKNFIEWQDKIFIVLYP